MAKKSSIEWTTGTWNPVTGCSRISDGCQHCYAERLAKRLCGMGNHRYKNGFRVTLHPQSLDEPLQWTKPQMIFVCSMGDLFHEDVPDDYILRVFDVMNKARHHIFQVLTKRSDRLSRISNHVAWGEHIWAGITVESDKYVQRIRDLQSVPADVRFLSLEPLLSAIPALPLGGVRWVIVGGESGVGARILKEEWVTDIKSQCVATNTAFFFKQWGGYNRKKTGRLLEGKTWDQMPNFRGNHQESVFGDRRF